MLKAVLIAQRELYVYVSLYFCVGDDKPIALVRNCVSSKRKRDMIDLTLLLPFFFFFEQLLLLPSCLKFEVIVYFKIYCSFSFLA